ncbi:hypothetical protein B0H21DRAFT_740856 [Amylocystis lapponica]|nr:hypothetical protein B0H21DRAFT_740856 [Amylocystis lapponica]
MSNQDLQAEYYESQFSKYHSTSRVFSDVLVSDEVNQYLDALTDVAQVLGIDDLSFSSYSAAISRLSAQELSSQQSVLRLKRAKNELSAHLASAQHEGRLVRKWVETLTTEAPAESSVPALERRKAMLMTKAREYQAELDALMAEMPEEPPATVSQLVAQVKELKSKEKLLKEMRAKVHAFQGLPPNLELARHELRNARDEHMKLVQLRERLLERMASGVS